MSWLFKLIGASGTNQAEVDASNQVKVVTDETSKMVMCRTDGTPLRTVAEGRLDVAQDTLLFLDSFDDTAVDARKWTIYQTTMTSAITSSQLHLNSGAVTTASTNSGVMSHARHGYQHESAIYAHAAIMPINLPATNATAEWGFGFLASATDRSAPTDGAFFRWKSDGTCECVLSFGGTETSVAITAPSQNVLHHMEVELNEEECIFEIDGVEVAEILAPASTPPTASSRLPTFARVYNAGVAPSAAPQLKLAGWAVTQQMLQTGRDSRIIAVTQGEAGISLPTTPYASPVTNQQVLPAGAAQSNTAAQITAYAGRFNLNAAAGADLTSPVDALLQAVTVPSNRRFICTGYIIHCGVAGAAVVTATLLEFSVFFNSTADSLATADGFTTSPQPTYAPRRVFAGTFHFPAAAAIGYAPLDVRVDFSGAPIVVESGRRFGVVCRQVAGAATASLTYRGYVQPLGFWE
jgi:hypothetical protein